MYLVGAIPLAFLLVLLALSLAIQAGSQTAAAFEQRTQTVLGQVDELRRLVEQASRAATSPQVASSGVRLADARAAVEGQLRTLERSVAREPDMAQPMRVLRAAVGAGIDLLGRYAAQRRAGHTAAARALANASSTRALALRITAAYDGFIGRERRIELVRLTNMRARSAGYEAALIAACMLGILLTLLISGRFGLRIAQRLAQLAENARRLARGETAARLQGNDEFSDLDVVYQAMMRRIAREHKIASTLQRMLLPRELPAFEGIRIDTAYVPAAHETDIGGDWYDVFNLADRCICISIGDVAGHGLRAATIMAGARLAVRTAARMQTDPAQIMSHLNRVMCADEPGTLVTALIAIFNIDDGTLRYAVAGHPEPLVIRTDGELQFLEGRGLVLGADANARYETFDARLHEGWALLLYTDGLVEVGRNYLEGLNDLREAASAEYASASENIAQAIQQRIFREREADDDTAVLFFGVTRLGAQPLRIGERRWVFDARDAQSAHRAKRAILWHLGNEIRDKEQLAAVELILGELVGNVARHSPGSAEVTIDENNGKTLLCVADKGRPFNSSGQNGGVADLLAESGRGLFLVRSMSQEVRIANDGSGNVITAVLAPGREGPTV